MSRPRDDNRLELVARFGPSQVDVAGAANELLELAAILKSGPARVVYELLVPRWPATPYDGFLSSIEIRVRDGSVQILRTSDAIEIQGSAEGLATVAQNIEFLVASQSDPQLAYPATHIHVEYYPEHPFLDSEAEPLTISLGEVKQHPTVTSILKLRTALERIIGPIDSENRGAFFLGERKEICGRCHDLISRIEAFGEGEPRTISHQELEELQRVAVDLRIQLGQALPERLAGSTRPLLKIARHLDDIAAQEHERRDT